MNKLKCMALLLPLLLGAGCTQESAEPAAGTTEAAMPADETDRSLAGTSWQLVAINGMDDSVAVPDERSKYTLSFDKSGAVALRADCNRGRGDWVSESAGQLQFGPFATTRAMCPPGSLHDRFLMELEYVRSYVLRDGKLHLATMADGSIIEFEPAPAAE